MRPALIAFAAAILPLGAYAHRGATPPVEAMPASKAAAAETVARNTVANADTLAAATPDVPSKEPPLCASPAVSAWNPAATGDGRICTPTQWAHAQSARRG